MATLAAPVIRERCHYCSRWKNSTEIIHLSGGAAMCWQCHEWHSKAIQHLEPPTGCQECRKTLDELRQLDPNGNVPMTVVCKDGIYEFLCKPCADAYIRKLGEADVAAIVEELADNEAITLYDPEKQVTNAIYVTLKAKGSVEKVEGRPGFWRAAA